MSYSVYAETSTIPFGFNLVAACEQVAKQIEDQLGGELQSIQVSTDDVGGRELQINATGSAILGQRQLEEMMYELTNLRVEDEYSHVLVELELVKVDY